MSTDGPAGDTSKGRPESASATDGAKIDLVSGPDGQAIREFFENIHVDGVLRDGKRVAYSYSQYCTYFIGKDGEPVPHGVFLLADFTGPFGARSRAAAGFRATMEYLLQGQLVVSGFYNMGARWGPWTVYGADGQPVSIVESGDVDLPSWTRIEDKEVIFSTKYLVHSMKVRP